MSTPTLVSGSRMLRTADWLFDQELEELDRASDDAQYRRELEVERKRAVAKLERLMMRDFMTRLRTGRTEKHEVLGIVQAAYSPEHEDRLAKAMTRGFAAFTFVQMRIALREIRDEFHFEAEESVPSIERNIRCAQEAAYFKRRLAGGV